MSWFLLALGSALGMAIADYFTKRYFSDLPVAQVVLVRVLGLTPICLFLLILAPWPVIQPGFYWAVSLSLPLEVAATFLYLRAVQITPLGVSQPYFATTPLFTLLTAMAILGETPSWAGAAGVFALAAGAYAVNIHQVRLGWLAPLTAIGRDRGSRMMILAAALYAVTSVLGKVAIINSSPWFVAGSYPAMVALALALTIVLRGPVGWDWLRRPKGVAGVGLGVGTMMVFHFAAMALAPAAYMMAVKRSSTLIAVLMGGLLLGETRLAQHLAACALTVAGGALILLFG